MCSLFSVAPHLHPSTSTIGRINSNTQQPLIKEKQPNAMTLLTCGEVLVEGLGRSRTCAEEISMALLAEAEGKH